MHCRCLTVQHNHPNNECGKKVTEIDGLCKECHDKAADEQLKARPILPDIPPKR